MCVGGGGGGGGGSDYSREAIILPSGGDYSRVVINRGVAIILGNTVSARSRRPYVYEKKESIIRLN